MTTPNAQPGRGQTKSITVKAMPNEVLLVHVPDPSKSRFLAVNSIKETRYGKVISVGEPTGRYREAPVKEGDIILMQTATAGVAVDQIYHDNKLVHRLDYRFIMAIADMEEGDHVNE